MTCCDHCGQVFRPTDEGYLAFWVATQEDLRFLAEVQAEQPPPADTTPGA